MGKAPLRLTKSAAVADSKRECQNGYRAVEGTSLVPRKQINYNSSKTFSVRVSKLPASNQPGLRATETSTVYTDMDTLNLYRVKCFTTGVAWKFREGIPA
ncbi:hypothetical protein AVEN_122246-1 [Araneus ventricosus]|uniref:Uncharacterized protein n=1 Tax=Araneus ventricosus TaxID=182803 RepID=A0A4Y2H9V3_ARAVE|nr:hypothetical protein AVEN_122246-1 [Araneus ventricosus]